MKFPLWAKKYSVNISKNERTRYFLQLRGLGATYATRNAANEYVFTTSAYASTSSGCAFDITALDGFQMGYQFQDGDILKYYASTGGDAKNLRIIGQDGKWVITELQNLGTLDGTTAFLFEIYTPYKPLVTEPHWECGEIYTISNPGTLTRAYSALAGTLSGDVTLLSRLGTYTVEAMSPNDKFYKNWFTNAGRPNFKDSIGQVKLKDRIFFSNNYIDGSKSNGLSTFDALDTKDIPLECGAIQKLINTSKVQNEQGVIMLAICENQVVSIYLGEVQLVGSSQNEFVAQSEGVIGTLNVLKGSYGTTHPESVAEYRGNVFFWDNRGGKIIQYASNGLFPISNYKMSRFWKQFSDTFNSLSTTQIEALGGRPFVFVGVDPHHDELLFSIPKLLANPPQGFLPDYPSTIYPFDIWDGQGKAIVYKLDRGEGKPHWQGAYSFNPEGFISLQNKLYSFKNGHLYQHNDTNSYNNFYGVQYKSRIMVVANQLPSSVKAYDNVALESNLVPTLTYFRSEQPYQQASDLVDFDWRNIEGIWYATMLRNKLVPNATGMTTDGLLTGEKMRTHALRVMFEFSNTTQPLQLRFVNIGFTLSKGHTTIFK
jgi:hypothetical protein